MFGINSAGIKSKLKSFDDIISKLGPQIWTLQETKLKPNETIKCDILDNFQVYYLSRQESEGGGLAIGVTKDLESTLIREGDDQTEAMSVQVWLTISQFVLLMHMEHRKMHYRKIRCGDLLKKKII